MKSTKTTLFLFYYFIIIYFIYVALNSILFPKHSYPTYIVNGFFLLFTLYVTFKYVEIKRFMIPMYLFFIYLLILISFSSDFFYSAQIYIKTLIPALFLPISFSFIKDIDHLKKFNKILILLICLYLINFIIANIFKLGRTAYGKEGFFSLYVGNVFTEGLNSIAYILVILPLILYLNKRHKNLLFFRSIGFCCFIIKSQKNINIGCFYRLFLFNIF